MPEIVKMNAAHVAEIAEIEKVSFKTPWSAQMIADELKNPLANYFVVEKDAQVLAYMGYYRILDEAHITNIAVKPDEKRKGYGKALLSFVLDEMKDVGVSKVTLEVNEKNVAAKVVHLGKQELLLPCKGEIVIPKEEYVGIVAENSAVELTAED